MTIIGSAADFCVFCPQLLPFLLVFVFLLPLYWSDGRRRLKLRREKLFLEVKGVVTVMRIGWKENPSIWALYSIYTLYWKWTIHPIRIKRKCTYHCQLIGVEGGYSVTQNHLEERGKKSVAENADFFLFRMHYCSISRSGIPYNLSKKDADIFMLEICKKGSNRVVVF